MFNVFCRTEDPSIICLIPDAGTVPAFLRGQWKFDGKAADPWDGQSDFDRDAARATVRLTGFYVFTKR